MRIIAGSKRRLPLKTIQGKDTRPTTADARSSALFCDMASVAEAASDCTRCEIYGVIAGRYLY